MGILLVGDDEQLHVGAASRLLHEKLEAMFPRPLAQTATELAIRERRVLHIPDALAESGVPEGMRRIAQLMEAGTYAEIMAPMLWEDRGVGSIYVTRAGRSGAQSIAFSEKEMALLKTIADQAVIAIQNARLFHEIQDKSRALEIANQHKSEFLASQHVARAAHAAERDHRLLGSADRADVRRAQCQAGRLPEGHP
jgi:GAF domain-containing protein